MLSVEGIVVHIFLGTCESELHLLSGQSGDGECIIGTIQRLTPKVDENSEERGFRVWRVGERFGKAALGIGIPHLLDQAGL